MEVVVKACPRDLELSHRCAIMDELVDLFGLKQIPGGLLAVVLLILPRKSLASKVVSPLNHVNVAEFHLLRHLIEQV